VKRRDLLGWITGGAAAGAGVMASLRGGQVTKLEAKTLVHPLPKPDPVPLYPPVRIKSAWSGRTGITRTLATEMDLRIGDYKPITRGMSIELGEDQGIMVGRADVEVEEIDVHAMLPGYGVVRVQTSSHLSRSMLVTDPDHGYRLLAISARPFPRLEIKAGAQIRLLGAHSLPVQVARGRGSHWTPDGFARWQGYDQSHVPGWYWMQENEWTTEVRDRLDQQAKAQEPTPYFLPLLKACGFDPVDDQDHTSYTITPRKV